MALYFQFKLEFSVLIKLDEIQFVQFIFLDLKMDFIFKLAQERFQGFKNPLPFLVY